jgi:anti-anti-sigma factor
MQISQERIHVAVSNVGDVAIVDLFGEIDHLSMAALDTALDEVRARRPHHVVVDITATEFVSGAGYAALGRLSMEFERVVVCSKSTLAERILQIFGYDDVVCLTATQSDSCRVLSDEVLSRSELAG